ncbi:unnamed protein product [Mytilus coruscus]|uniref:Endonuclease/exonuclease/phosphatase domain-containing protein n=1 Tax=Mytilus coruscus TaxID=42192 RepID=A0A6J8ETT7_MYTCO|nr:unnamed protein product [Mytilus coruscus]
MDSIEKKISGTVGELKKNNDQLKEKLVDVHLNSMRNNLIFYNIPEDDSEYCSDVVFRFCVEFLKIAEPETNLRLTKAYRIGKKSEKVRPILVKLQTPYMRDLVKKNAKQLKDTNFGISEQLPVEIQNRRREKLPLLKELRQKNIKAYFVRDQIYVGGKDRIGIIDDILENDNLDKYVSSFEHIENPIIPKRHSLDSTTNAYGRKLLQLCFNTGLTAANSRLGKDQDGKFTFCTSKGRSVNDYLLLSPDDYKLLSDFNVLEFNEHSDHAPLFFELVLADPSPKNFYPKIHNILKWDDSKTNDFVESIQQQTENLTSLVSNISNADDIKSAVSDVSNILYNNAFKVFGRSILIRDKTNTDRPDNEWFDVKCASARDQFHRARNFFFRQPTETNRLLYVTERNNYNKVKRKAKFNYKRRKGEILCNVAKTEPRKFWSAVRKNKRNTGCKIDNASMLKHFESILGDNPPELCDEVLNLMSNSVFENLNVNDLDIEISEEEIKASIHKMKFIYAEDKSKHSTKILPNITCKSTVAI